MRLDAGQVLKRAVFCPRCNEEYLFTLRAIAEHSELNCPCCGTSIQISGDLYEPLVRDVRKLVEAIDSAQTHMR
jgi:transcription elongation factor Elf1